jgi:hypothetical protein
LNGRKKMIEDHQILLAIREANVGSGGRFGPANLEDLSRRLERLTGTKMSKSGLSYRINILFEGGWVEGTRSGTRGTVTITLRPTDRGLALIELMELANANLETNGT